MRKYTRKQVQKLSNDQYVLIIMDECVYDVTSFLNDHPGGKNVLTELLGQDATNQFNMGHSQAAKKLREAYLIGQVVPESSIFTNKWFYVALGVLGIALWSKYKGRVQITTQSM